MISLKKILTEATVKLKKTISKQEWDRIPKYNKHIGQDGTKYIMQYSDNMGTYLQGVNVSDGKYYVGYNKGRGQGTGVFKDVFTSYDVAKKEVEKTEKLMKGGSNMTAYYVADKDGNPIRESVNEGKWSKIMAGVRKGSQSGPWTFVIIRNKKVIHQERVNYRDSIPAHYESLKKEFRNGFLAIEDNSGKIVYQERI